MYCTPCNTQNFKFLKLMLSQSTQLKILAYISAHLSSTSSDTITFDTDSKESIVDSGCSRTLTFDRKDFITYEETDGEVEGLGTHKIVGTGTVKYTVLDDDGVMVV